MNPTPKKHKQMQNMFAVRYKNPLKKFTRQLLAQENFV